MFDRARFPSFVGPSVLSLGLLLAPGCSMSMAPSDAPVEDDAGPLDAPRRDAYVVIVDGGGGLADGDPGPDGGLHFDALVEIPDGSLADGAFPDAHLPDGAFPDVETLDGYFPDGYWWDAGAPDAPLRDGAVEDATLGFDGSTGPSGPPCGGGFCDLSMICCPGVGICVPFGCLECCPGDPPPPMDPPPFPM